MRAEWNAWDLNGREHPPTRDLNRSPVAYRKDAMNEKSSKLMSKFRVTFMDHEGYIRTKTLVLRDFGTHHENRQASADKLGVDYWSVHSVINQRLGYHQAEPAGLRE